MKFQLLKKETLISLALWVFFSFALARFFAIFFFPFAGSPAYTITILCLYCLLSFSYYFIAKKRFLLRLNYTQFIIYNLLFSLLIALLSYIYFRSVMLNNDHFHFRFYIMLLIVNFLSGSLLYSFTLIKKREI